MKVREWQNTVPLRVTRKAVKHLSSLHQFDAVPDEILIRLARLRTKIAVADRLGAVAMLANNPCPLPVPHTKKQSQRQPRWKLRAAIARPRLRLIKGGRSAR